ncbi:MAG: DUF4197 family protein [Pacificimonas sp.]
MTIQNRRQMLGALGAGSALLVLPACATNGLGGLGLPNLSNVLKDLLGLSTERAFARLVEPDGFLTDSLARLELPDELSSTGNMLAGLLQTPFVRDQLAEQVNRAASFAATAAEPVVEDAISRLTFADAEAVLRGGPQAATSVLQGRVGESLGERMIPALVEGLGIGNADIVTSLLSSATGIDVQRFAGLVGQDASAAIFKAIGREEADIRANPEQTNNPALISALTLLG